MTVKQVYVYSNVLCEYIMKTCTKCKQPKLGKYKDLCKKCYMITYSKAYRVENAAHLRAKKHEYYISNKDKIKQLNRKYILDGSKRMWDKAYRERHRDKLLKYDRARYISNRGKILSYWKEYRKNNKERSSLYKHNYKARKRTAIVASRWDITDNWWSNVLQAYDGKCVYCGVAKEVAIKAFMKDGRVSYGLTPDHVTSLSKGGLHAPGNILPACMQCQVSKQAKTLEEFVLDADKAAELRGKLACQS